jgi:hypothetical protein
MRKERPFDIAKPRTPKGEARVRERVAMDAMGTLTEIGDEETFKEILNRVYGIKPGEPRYEAALRAWREALTSK